MTISFLVHNIKRRLRDGFAIGYNLIFPLLVTGLIGALTRKVFNNGVSSYQYYTIVLIPFSIAFGLVTAIYAAKDDAYAKTAIRILITPIEAKTIVFCKVITCTFIFTILATVCFGVLALITKMPLSGQAYGSILLFCICFSFVMSAIGTWIGLSTESFLKVKNIVMIPVAIFASIGGTFYPFRSSEGLFNEIICHSPFYLINKAYFMQIYDHNGSLLVKISMISLLFGICFTVLSIKNFNREEYTHGDIPGYEN